MLQNKTVEIERGREILEDAEWLWGWGTTAGKLRAERRAGILIDMANMVRGRSVLEIGCGTGMFTRKISKDRADLAAVDISHDLLRKAKQEVDLPEVEFVQSDIEQMPFGNMTFDAVVGICVLHHLNMDAILPEVRRVLKKGGRIVFCEPNMMNPQLLIQKNVKPIKKIRILGETLDETAFFRWQLSHDLKRVGFTDISIVPFDFLHPWTPPFMIPAVNKIGILAEKMPLIKEIAGSLIISACVK